MLTTNQTFAVEVPIQHFARSISSQYHFDIPNMSLTTAAPENTLLGLPAELRNAIYEFTFAIKHKANQRHTL